MPLVDAPAVVADGVGRLVEERLAPVGGGHVGRDADDVRRAVLDDAPRGAPRGELDAGGGEAVGRGEGVVEGLERGLVGDELGAGGRRAFEEVELDERFDLHDSPSSASR